MKNHTASSVPVSEKLTSWEWEALESGYNIADGHAHQAQSLEYLEIINRLPQIYLAAESTNQKAIQREFETAFFALAGQKSYKNLRPPLYQNACSLSIEVIANYLRNSGKSVALIHPTFDNLADILKRHGVALSTLEEHDFLLSPIDKLGPVAADALFLVCPNNPTGTDISREQYLAIINYCKKYQKLLIVDCSFRFYSSLTDWDQYAALRASGIDFIVMEDTGKTWPTFELKIGITLASDSIYQALADITNDFLLNVSPFVVMLLTEYLKADLHNAPSPGARKVVAVNRAELKQALKGLPLRMTNPNSPISVAWLKLPASWQATPLCTWLAKHKVHALPGSPFYWNDHARGESYVRIALLRPYSNFSEAMVRLREALEAYRPDK